MSSTIEDILTVLDRMSETSDHPRHRFAAAITLRNKIVSFGTNRKKSHPFQKKFGKNEHCIYLHAEVNAIKNALKHCSVDDLKKSTLTVLRAKDSKRLLAKPCDGCMKAIIEFGIKTVYYTTEEGIEKLEY